MKQFHVGAHSALHALLLVMFQSLYCVVVIAIRQSNLDKHSTCLVLSMSIMSLNGILGDFFYLIYFLI